MNHMTMLTCIVAVVFQVHNRFSQPASFLDSDHGRFTLRPHFLRDGILPR